MSLKKWIVTKNTLCLYFQVREGLEQISTFLSSHAREVVFLDFNHFYGVQNMHHEKLVAMLKDVFGEKLCPVVFAQEVLTNLYIFILIQWFQTILPQHISGPWEVVSCTLGNDPVSLNWSGNHYWFTAYSGSQLINASVADRTIKSSSSRWQEIAIKPSFVSFFNSCVYISIVFN